jgi:hypothetical protein
VDVLFWGKSSWGAGAPYVSPSYVQKNKNQKDVLKVALILVSSVFVWSQLLMLVPVPRTLLRM